MNIIQNHITNTVNRPGSKIKRLEGLVIHWIGVCQTKASVIRNNFQNATKKEQGGTQYILDWNDGSFIQTMPELEVAWHCGGTSYTDLKRNICGSDNPNNYFVGIECCIGDKSIPTDYENAKYTDLGKPSNVQYAALVEFCADFCKRHNLDPLTQLFLHNHITGKSCHTWFVHNSHEWTAFKQKVKNKMNEEEIDMEELRKLQEQVAALTDVLLPKYGYVDDFMPDWARPTIAKLVSKGFIKGDEDGNLQLSYADLRHYVVLDRAGVFGE